MELTLPGGLNRDGVVYRSALLEPLNGYVEQAIAEALDGAANLPAAVSTVLGSALRSIGGIDANAKTAAALCVADRHYLMYRLAQLVDGDHFWLHAACARCGSPFDVDLNRSDLPVKPAGRDYPFADVPVAQGRVRLRVPNGADQACITDLGEPQALRQLLTRIIVSVDPLVPHESFVDRLGAEDLAHVEEALEEVSPAMCTRVQTRCPECEAEQTVGIDPYVFDSLGQDALWREVHTLAFFYHWNELDILSLPRERRHRYLGYIDNARGLYS